MKNFNRRLGKCFCKHCGIEFEKPLSEINRNLKLDRPNYCCRSCVGKAHIGNFGDKRSDYNISKHSDNKRDEYTYFRYHFRNIKSRERGRGVEVTVTIEDLKKQWDEQNGKCEFTGINLKISEYKKISTNQIYSASLDRIDSNKGYVKGNIRWVSRAINHMKNTMSDEMVWELCGLIYENYKQKRVIV